MNLVLHIALTHVISRVRQTLVGVMGIATGVGCSIMMAGLMEGSQIDFIRQLVDSIPHVSVSDEKRDPSVQPSERHFASVQFHNLSSETERRGFKNPYAVLADLEEWLPGAVTPSVQTKALLRSGTRDTAASLIGIDPHREAHVSKLATQMKAGTLDSLFKASNAVILGDTLAERLGVGVGSSITLMASSGAPILARIVGLSHSGIRQIDDNQAVTLIKTAQVLAGKTALLNEFRIRVDDVMSSRDIAARVEKQTGYKAVSWQKAHEDILSAFQIRNVIMFMVVGAILLVASFGTYNIISTITHEKARDIAIMKSLGLREQTVRRIFVLESAIIGVIGIFFGWMLGYALCIIMGLIEFKSFMTDMTHLPILYSPRHYAIAGGVALASSLLAGFLPARKAASVQPVEIIRGAS
jgi:lipoprotein-releasing system permease protein